MLNIVIVGAGGCARDVYQWAKDTLDKNEYSIKGFISNNPGDLDGYSMDVGIIGNDENYVIQENDRFLMGIGDIDIKKRVAGYLKQRGARFITLIHKTAVVVPSAKIGEGVIICPFCLVSDHVVIGDFVLMNFYSSCGHDSKVGHYSVLAPNSTINGFSVLEDEVFLATHATVIAYKKVGYKSKISANSVAMSDVAPFSFVYGVPGVSRTFFKKWGQKAGDKS